MHPLLQYKIPLPDAGIHSSWNVIITDEARHFYYNAELQRSYWQLADVQREFPLNSDSGVDVDELAAAIDFDSIAVLMSKARGFPVREESALNQDQGIPVEVEGESGQSDTNTSITSGHSDSPGTDTENPVPSAEIDTEARDLFISALLSEETSQSEINHKRSDKLSQSTPIPPSIIGGYSSSDSEEDNDPNNEKEIHEESHASAETAPLRDAGSASIDGDEIHQRDADIPSTDFNLDLGLQSSEEETLSSSHGEFKQLLGSLKSKLDLNLPWLLVEEDLMTELVQCPEYFAVGNSAAREQLYNEWCLTQNPMDSANEPNNGIYPTLTVKFLHFLQQHKADVKRSFFAEFKTRMHQQLQEYMSLGEKRIEMLFRQFKIMIVDFAAHEKQIKASSKYDPSVNLKRLELERYLQTQLPAMKASFRSESKQVFSNEHNSEFDRWMDIANCYLIPVPVIECVTNFIVGDEKRLACYQELVERYLV